MAGRCCGWVIGNWIAIWSSSRLGLDRTRCWSLEVVSVLCAAVWVPVTMLRLDALKEVGEWHWET